MKITIKCGNVDITDRVLAYTSTYETQKKSLIGNVISKQCLFDLDNKDDFFTKEKINDVFIIYYDGLINNVLRVYDEPQNQNKQLSLILYDSVVQLNKEFETDPKTYPKTFKAVIDEIGEQVGNTFDTSLLDETFLNRQIHSYDENETCRQIISWIAELSASNVISNPNGTYRFIPYTTDVIHTITDNDVERFETNEEYRLKRVVYDNGVALLEHKAQDYTESDNTLFIDGSTLYKVNQEDVDFIYTQLNEPILTAIKNIRFATTKEIKPFETVEYQGYFKFCPMNVAMRYSQGVDTFHVAEVEGDFDTTNKQSVNKIPSTKKAIRRLQVIQNEQQNSLEIIAKEQDENKELMSSIKVDMEGIKQQVSKQEEVIQEYKTKPDLYVRANLPCQQIYDIANKKYIPDFTVQNLTLTPIVTVDGKISAFDGNNIVWKKRGGELGTHEVVKDGILTISQNLALEERSTVYECYIKYNIKGEEYKQSNTATIELSLVQDGSEGIQGEDGVSCQIVSNARDFITADSITFTPTEITLTPYLQGCTYDLWQYGYDGIQWENVVNNENGIAIQDNGILTVQSDSALFTEKQFIIFKLLTNKLGVIDTFTISRTIDYKATIENIEQNLGGVQTIIENTQVNFDTTIDGIRSEVAEIKNTQTEVDGKIENVREEMKTQIEHSANGINITISEIKKEIADMSNATNLIETYFNASDKGLAISQSGNETSTLMAYDHFAILIGEIEVMQIFRDVLKGENAQFSKSVKIGHIKATQHAGGVAFTWED